MAKRSISDCRWAIQIARGRDMTTLGMTVTLGGEQMLITDLRVIDKQWVSGDRRFTPREKELLTKQARAIIAEDEAFRDRFRTPPVISIKECQEAIAIAGGIPITLRGEKMFITELKTHQMSKWVSGDRRFTPREKELLTKQARAIIAEDEAFRDRFRTPPVISIKECQEAIAIAGGIPITLRGEKMFITELKTHQMSKWVSGDRRFTPREKELLTKQARAIIAEHASLPVPAE